MFRIRVILLSGHYKSVVYAVTVLAYENGTATGYTCVVYVFAIVNKYLWTGILCVCFSAVGVYIG